MNVKIQSIHFDADQKLIELIHEKVAKLSHFWEHIVDCDVILRVEKSETHANKIMEIKIHVPGKLLFAKEQDHTFERALESAVAAISRQVIKEKEKARGL